VLAATPPDALLRHGIYHQATPLPSYVAGRVVLLGGAAHAMTPALGQGACQAVEDAVVLTALTAGTAELPAAYWVSGPRGTLAGLSAERVHQRSAPGDETGAASRGLVH
jgi:hypothetical protein